MKINNIWTTATVFSGLILVNSSVFADGVFTVNNSGAVTSGSTAFQADAIRGSFNEAATFYANGTFATTAFVNLTSFIDPSYGTDIPVRTTQLGYNYNLYAEIIGTGNYSVTATTEQFVYNAGTVALYLDDTANQANDVTALASLFSSHSITGGNSISQIAAFTLLGSGNLFPGSTNSSGSVISQVGVNIGQYGLTSSWGLTQAGQNFFTLPTSFYHSILGSGDLQNVNGLISGSGIQYINGTTTVTFGNSVPVPGAFWLFASALLGFTGLSRRKHVAI